MMFKRKNKASEEENNSIEDPIFGGAAAPDNLSTDFDSAFSDDEDQDNAFLEGQNDALVYDKTFKDDEESFDSDENSEGADVEQEDADVSAEAAEASAESEEDREGVDLDQAESETSEERDVDTIDEQAGIESAVAVEAGAAQEATAVPAHAKHGKVKEEPDYKGKSRRTRRMLIVVLILLVVLVGALGYFAWQLYEESQNIATQQVSDSSIASSLDKTPGTTKENAVTTKKTQVPNLVAVLGKTQEEAIAAIGHGATAASNTPVNEEGNPVKARVTVALTEEPSDARSGAPSVYLGLNEEGKVVMAGYSAATASLGYGSVSFSDAVSKEHIVQSTFSEAGLTLTSEDVVLPPKSEYSSYAGDGTTLVRETCSFNGETAQSGTTYKWTSVLTYDYTAANATGNLADTIRQIYIYVNL